MAVALINPSNGLALERQGDELRDSEGNPFPIVAGIPRMCAADNYADSYGLQWNWFERVQIDRPGSGQMQSEQRLFAATGWNPDELGEADILEVGSGAGRFTRVLLQKTRARIWSVDFSSAVEANSRNNRDVAGDRLVIAQASIYELPFRDGSFDKVLCLGVLQHTPDFEASVAALIRKARPGGEIVVDFYPIRGFWTNLHAKYLLRPFTRRMSHERLLALIDRNAGWMIKLAGALRRWKLGALTRLVPIVDERVAVPAGLTAEQHREWVVLDTFDMFSPEYDNPQRLPAVARMFERHGAKVILADFIDVGGGARAAVVRARRV